MAALSYTFAASTSSTFTPGESFPKSLSSSILTDIHYNIPQRLEPMKVQLLPEQPPRQTRRRSGSFTYTSGSTFASGTLAPSRVVGLVSTKRTPPIPLSIKFDPFGSDCDDKPPPAPQYTHTWTYDPVTKGPKMCGSLPQPAATVVQLPPRTCSPPSYRPPSVQRHDRNASSKVIATILLNRIHAVGKPKCPPRVRSAPGLDTKCYVRSNLSNMVCFEC
ncbi:hypothetical protein C8J56DRAFT_959225 [Mycena floridula]|nr:hypothetical protein C8J56DRAFT_959225 [Mycena floridula]